MNATQLEAVRRVAEARRRFADARAAVDGPMNTLKEQLAGEIAAMQAASLSVTQAEAELRALALAAYEASGEKKPFPGVALQVRTKLEYDPAAALAWAREAHIAVVPEQLDTKAFEKIAGATDLPFVTKLAVPVATIASDLDAVLPPEPETPAVVATDNDEDWLNG